MEVCSQSARAYLPPDIQEGHHGATTRYSVSYHAHLVDKHIACDLDSPRRCNDELRSHRIWAGGKVSSAPDRKSGAERLLEQVVGDSTLGVEPSRTDPVGTEPGAQG
jgi:hypothetical protein